MASQIAAYHDKLIHIVVLRIALIILQVGKRSRLNADIESPALMGSKGYPSEGHLPAVQITRDGNGGHRHLAGGKVVARGDGNHSLGCQAHTTIDTEGLRDIPAEARSTVIDILHRVVEAIIETEVPRYREVVVLTRHPLSSHSGIERAVRVGPRVEVLGREGGDIVTCHRILILARTEGVAKAPTCILHTTR